MPINVQGLIQKSQLDAEAIRKSQPVGSAVPVTTPSVTAVKPERKFMQGGAGGKILDYLNVLESGIAGFAKGGREETLKQEKLYGPGGGTNTLFTHPDRFFQKISAGIKAVPEAIKNRTYFGDQPGQVDIGGGIASDLGIKNKYAGKVLNLATSLTAPVPPVGKVFSVGGKIAGKIPGTARAVHVISGVGKTAKTALKTSERLAPIRNVITKVEPFAFTPELKPLVREAEDRMTKRLGGLFDTLKTAVKGLSRAEQARVGQLLEGGVEVSGKYGEIARPIREMADAVGKEAVDLGLLDAASYEKYRGKYMSHIWEDALGKSGGGISGDIRKISGRFFRHRSGKEGYIREFATPSWMGLGTEIKDVEKARLYQNIAGKYGAKVVGVSEKEAEAVAKRAGQVGQEIERTKILLGEKRNKLFQVLNPAEDTRKPIGLLEAPKQLVDPTKPLQSRAAYRTPVTINKPLVGKGFILPTGEHTRLALGVSSLEKKLAAMSEKKASLLSKAVREVPEGFQYAPEALTNTRAGKLFKDVALPKEVVEYLNATAKIPAKTIFDTMLNMWKAGKTVGVFGIPNAAYHVRNLLSNQILSDMSTGKGLLRTVVDYVDSVAHYFGKGNQKFVQAAEDVGLIKNKNFGATLNEFLETSREMEQRLGGSKVRKVLDFPGRFQQVSEETAKLNVFKSWIEKLADDARKTVDDVLADPSAVRQAVDKAEEAIFSPYRIGAAERHLMSRVIPFYSFSRQAFPFTIKTLVQHPERLMKYPRIKRGVENLSDKVVPEEQRQEYQRGYGVQLPFKNREGKNLILDTKYLLPFGNFLEGVEGSVNKGGLPLGLNISPFISEFFQSGYGGSIPGVGEGLNKDQYFNQPIATSNIPERRKVQLRQHAFRTFAPQIFPTDITGIPSGYRDMPYRTRTGEKLAAAFEGRLDYAGRERNKAMAILDALGIKTSILRPEEKQKFDSLDKRKQLREIQAERARVTRNKQLRPEEKRLLLKELRQVQ